jgi:hypothetical protein
VAAFKWLLQHQRHIIWHIILTATFFNNHSCPVLCLLRRNLQVAEWLWGQVGGAEPAPEMSVPMKLAQGLRYGENPHQAAAFYTDGSLAEFEKGGIATAVQHHGKEMSYNNYLDADAAYSCCCDFKVRRCRLLLQCMVFLSSR